MIMALLVCVWGASAPMQTESERGYLARARELVDRGELAEAIDPLKKAHELHPDAPEVLWMLAVAHFELGRASEGVSYAEALVRAVPGAARAHLLLASYRGALGEEAAAIEEYRAVLATEPDNPQALHDLAMLYLGRGEDELAVSALERVLDRYPEDARALVPLGVSYFRLGRAEEALRTLTRAVKAEPDSTEAHHYLGALYSKLGRYELASSHLKKALEIGGDDPKSLFQMGLVYARQEELEKAKTYFESALAGRPRHAETYLQLAQIYRYENDFERASDAFRKVISLDEKNAVASFELGRMDADAGRPREAVTWLRRAVELDPDYGEAHDRLARAYDKLGEDEKARRHFELALTLRPFAPEPRLSYGNFLLRRGERERGRELLERFRSLKREGDRIKELRAAIRFDPAEPTFKKSLIDTLLELGRSEEALEESERFLTLATMEPAYYVLVARVREARAEYEQAVSVLKKGRSRLEGVSVLDAAYAKALVLTGRPEQAEEVLAGADLEEADVQETWAWVHHARGDEDAAEASFLGAIELDPRNPERYLARAGWLFERGLKEVAMTTLEDAVRKLPDEAALHRHLSELYALSGRDAEAKRSLARAEELLLSGTSER